MERERAAAGAGAVLVLDAGNALFKTPAGREPQARERAELLLAQMDALGTRALAVGARDLALGPDFLRRWARGRTLQPLSANLVGADGKPLFAPSLLVRAGGLAVGIIGASPEGPHPVHASVVGRPPLAPVLAEARRLRAEAHADVVVLLAALPYAQALALAQEAGEVLDVVVQSHEGRGAVGLAQRVGRAALFPGGERGRMVARLEVRGAGQGALVDLDEAERARQSLAHLDGQIATTRQRLEAEQDPERKKAWDAQLASFEAARRLRRAQAEQAGGGRGFRLRYVTLGPEVPSDPGVRARVERVEPPGSAGH